jgi:hypothetical protein
MFADVHRALNIAAFVGLATLAGCVLLPLACGLLVPEGPKLANSAPKDIENALRKHVDELAVEIGPRTPFDGDSLARAAAYIRAAFEEAGLPATEQAYDYQGRRVANLIATLPGQARASAYYVVGAHYDTVRTTPGADDNASAVAVLLELARHTREAGRKLPVRFVAFTLEEPPASDTPSQGSRVFVRAGETQGDRVLGGIILEMVGVTSPIQNYPLMRRWPFYPAEGNFIGIVANWRSWRFGWAVRKGFRKNPHLPVRSVFLPFDGRFIPEARWSDHASFWDAGLPALMVTDTAFFRNPNYHLPSDTIETLDFGFMAELVRSLELALRELPPG